MYYNDLGKVANNNVYRWTFAAMECYKNGTNCDICTLEHLRDKCKMKTVLIELVRKHGLPDGIKGMGVLNE